MPDTLNVTELCLTSDCVYTGRSNNAELDWCIDEFDIIADFMPLTSGIQQRWIHAISCGLIGGLPAYWFVVIHHTWFKMVLTGVMSSSPVVPTVTSWCPQSFGSTHRHLLTPSAGWYKFQRFVNLETGAGREYNKYATWTSLNVTRFGMTFVIQTMCLSSWHTW